MNLRELQDVLEEADDVFTSQGKDCMGMMTKLDKNMLLFCVKWTLGTTRVLPRKFTQEEIDAMDDAPTVGLGTFNKPHDIDPDDLAVDRRREELAAIADEVTIAEKVDEQNIL